MPKSKTNRPQPPTQAGTVIRKHEAPAEFAGPKSFRGTGSFSQNGFKAEDRSC